MTLDWQTFQNAFWNLTHRVGIIEILDILVVTVIIYELLSLIRHTRGISLLKGLFLLVVMTFVSNLFGMTALTWLLNTILSNGAVVLVVLFQPELRAILEQMGRGAVLEPGQKKSAPDENSRVVQEIVQCCLDLSRRRVGALIVFEQKTGLQDLIETGTAIDGRISAPLLENIFEPNTPLHDGAVIVRGTRVVAGACILNLTEKRDVNRELGTRHRAALGVSETTDAVALIVSEETGVISIARAGELIRHLDERTLQAELGSMYEEKKESLLTGMMHRLSRARKEKLG